LRATGASVMTMMADRGDKVVAPGAGGAPTVPARGATGEGTAPSGDGQAGERSGKWFCDGGAPTIVLAGNW